MARKRVLRPDEADLWQAVARTARPMHGKLRPPEAEAAPDPVVKVPELPPLDPWPRPSLPVFRLGERAQSARSNDLAPSPHAGPLAMDAGTHKRMTRGRLAPDARLDLHGMTLAEAHPELIRFILNAQTQGHRLVLVITGKGRQMWDPVPRPMGALRHQVPHWLRLPPLSHAVLQTAEAHLKHGGTGALYVYLRRR